MGIKHNTKVTHVTLATQLALKGKMYRRNIFDGQEGMPGVEMSLCPGGVLCRQGGMSFIIPFSQCASIVVEEEK